MVGYLYILVRWIIYHIDTLPLLFIPTLVATFHVQLISSSGFVVSCHMYFRVQLFVFVCLLIRVVSSESTRADYSLLYLVRFYCRGGSSDQQLLFDRALTSVVFFMIIFCSSLMGHSLAWRLLYSFTSSFSILFIYFWSRVFPMWFSLFLLFTEIWLCLGT